MAAQKQDQSYKSNELANSINAGSAGKDITPSFQNIAVPERAEGGQPMTFEPGSLAMGAGAEMSFRPGQAPIHQNS